MRVSIPPTAWFLAALAAVGASAAVADPRPAALAVNLVLGVMLLLLAWIDLRTFRLPDAITFPLVAMGLAVAAMSGEPPPEQALAGAVLGFACFALLGWAYRVLRGRDGIGLGDAKLLAGAGAWLGAEALPEVLLIAALAGLAQAAIAARGALSLRAETMIPFGPAIALAIWLVRLCGGGTWWGG